MTDTIARIKVANKPFETMVDLDEALKVRKGEGDITAAWRDTNIYSDQKKGMTCSNSDLEEAFKTTDLHQIAERIMKKGEIQLTQEHRDEAQELKKKQIIDWLIRNGVDSRSDRPFTPDAISSAMDQAGVNVDGKKPVDQQISGITQALKSIIPIKIETKKIAITIPAAMTGKVYGLLNEYKEKEEWLNTGDLKCILNIPVGLQMEFYDKLNNVTHGSAITEEIKED
jgi:ribosome maturation protein SDO1